MNQPKNAVSVRELAFVRDVLIPRVWVRGAEVDELVRLRARLDSIFAELGQPAGEGVPSQEAASATPAS